MKEEYIKTARKYIPSLTPDQEDLIRSIARCPNHNGTNEKAKLYGRESMWKKCFCKLDLIVNMSELNTEINNLERKKNHNLIYKNPYKEN